MPRPNPGRVIRREEDLAGRIAYERERLGWTYEGLAARVTAAGCPIQASAIYKIEKGSPRRRITVDEAVAFSSVFRVALEDLLVPTELVAEETAKRAITKMTKALPRLEALGDMFDELWTELDAALPMRDSKGRKVLKVEQINLMEDVRARIDESVRRISGQHRQAP